MDAKTPYLMEVDDLRISFATRAGRLNAIDGVNLGIRRGETVGLVGESGSGKSTIAKAMMRAIPVDSGRILFDGAEIGKLDRKSMKPIRRRIQMVFQDPYSSLNPRMRIRDIIAEPLQAHRWGSRIAIQERIAEITSSVGLDSDSLDRLPQEFSGGQRQRIAIARALALEPDMLIADEPVSALDVSIQAQIINLLRDIQRWFGITYLVIAHDLPLIHQISQRIAVMYLGRIVEEGSADELVASPAHPYTVSLLEATPSLEPGSRLKKIILAGEPPSAINRPSGCAFHPRCPIARGRCTNEQPTLRDLGNRHAAACHYPKELSITGREMERK